MGISFFSYIIRGMNQFYRPIPEADHSGLSHGKGIIGRNRTFPGQLLYLPVAREALAGGRGNETSRPGRFPQSRRRLNARGRNSPLRPRYTHPAGIRLIAIGLSIPKYRTDKSRNTGSVARARSGTQTPAGVNFHLGCAFTPNNPIPVQPI